MMMDANRSTALIEQTPRPMRPYAEELAAHPVWRENLTASGAAPLLSRDGQNIGLIQLADKIEGDFTEEDEAILAQLTQLASVALQNTTLFKDVLELNAGLERKVEERASELASKEALYRTLTERAPQIISYMAPDGKMLYLNKAWHDLVGGEPGGWLGDRWREALHPEGIAAVNSNWAQAVATQGRHEGERRFLGKSGAYHTMHYIASPVFDHDGRVIYWVGGDADIATLKQVEEALRFSNNELEAFSYSVSHDLCSPLAVIDGYSRAILQKYGEQMDRDSLGYLERIRVRTVEMAQMIEELLGLARVMRSAVRYERFDLGAIAARVIEDYRAREPQRNVEIKIQPDIMVRGDPRLLSLVLDNLIGNAWKFTSKKEAARISIGGMIGPDKQTEYFVADNGAGFNMAYSDKLFGTFQRPHSAADFPSTGVGLATVQRIISRHGGQVWAKSAQEQGATFCFTLGEPW
ncbi:MAG: ATP-binding protein [Candidatus Protistobacter heckmanni]|nr:ATP-binding protein [Candidatus Protistobacter heckmanni]